MMPELKVHAVGPLRGSGSHRSLCEQVILDGPYRNTRAKGSFLRGEVTCKPCRDRLPREEKVEGCWVCDVPGMKPPHDASGRCESGAKQHCSCEICF